MIKETRANCNSNMAAAVGRYSRCLSRFASVNRLLKQTPAVTCVRLVTRKHFEPKWSGISQKHVFYAYTQYVCDFVFVQLMFYIFLFNFNTVGH